jgi:hypothetical protein
MKRNFSLDPRCNFCRTLVSGARPGTVDLPASQSILHLHRLLGSLCLASWQLLVPRLEFHIRIRYFFSICPTVACKRRG